MRHANTATDVLAGVTAQVGLGKEHSNIAEIDLPADATHWLTALIFQRDPQAVGSIRVEIANDGIVDREVSCHQVYVGLI